MSVAVARDVHPLAPRLAVAWLVLFAGMAVFHTWPLAEQPATWSRHDNADAMLNEWAIAWVAHQLPRDPLRLFDANIFHPEPNTLAFSEHMIVQAVMGAPLLWAGLPSLLVHNLLLLSGLMLTAWTMSLVVYRWTGDPWASLVAGLLLAFNAHSLTRLAHLQAMHVEFLPLAVYALDRLLVRPRAPTAAWLGLAIALQSLTANYLLVMMAFAMSAAVAVRPGEWMGRGRGGTLIRLGLAAGLATIVLTPFLLPYVHAQREQGLVRSLATVSVYNATWVDYLVSGSRLHFAAWSARLWKDSHAALFPGFAALLLGAVAVASGLAWRNRAARSWGAIGVVGLILSLGTNLPGYVLLYHVVPLLQGIRAPVRLGYLVLAAVAALAGFGLAQVNRSGWLSSPRRRAAFGVLVAALVTAEAARLPLPYFPAYQVPAVYRVLASERPRAVVELPLPMPTGFQQNARYMMNSMVGWWPLVNGYSGFLPASYRARREELALFPSDESIAALRALGVTHAVVHRREFSRRFANALERLDAAPGLRQVVIEGDIAVYRIVGTGR